jgi:hypothetical protein
MKKPKMNSVIASRTYSYEESSGGEAFVELEIGKPIKSPHREEEFMCTFRLKLPGTELIETAYGIDGLQALLLALGSAQAKLKMLSNSTPALCWIGDENEDLGIRIPDFSS